MNPLASICRPPLDAEQILGYFNSLADLPAEAVLAAAAQIAASRKYPTWPMPGEIREVAARLISPQPTAGEAWLAALVAARKLADPWYDFSHGMPCAEWNARVWNSLPAAVAITLRIFGGRNMPGDGNTYARFRDEYERQVGQIRQRHTVPAPVLEMVARWEQEKFGEIEP